MDVEKDKMERVDESEVHLEAQRLSVVATAAIGRAMDIAGLRRAQVAEALGVPKSRVTKVLDGETNMTLKTLAQFGLACGVRWQFVGVKADDACVVVTAPESLIGGSPYVTSSALEVARAEAPDSAVSKELPLAA